MRIARGVAGLVGLAASFCLATVALAQQRTPPEVRRAQPANEPPAPRALPADQPTAAPPASSSVEPSTEPPPPDTESPPRRQLEYANALFTRKLYDLAAPEYQKYLDDYPGAS